MYGHIKSMHRMHYKASRRIVPSKALAQPKQQAMILLNLEPRRKMPPRGRSLPYRESSLHFVQKKLKKLLFRQMIPKLRSPEIIHSKRPRSLQMSKNIPLSGLPQWTTAGASFQTTHLTTLSVEILGLELLCYRSTIKLDA